MKRLLSAAAAAALLAAPAHADLGAADSGDRQQLSGRKHEAWCGTETNLDCIVQFKDGRMIVNAGTGIEVSQVRRIIHSQKFFADHAGYVKGAQCNWLGLGPKHCHQHYEFNYTASDGSDRWATIRFMNLQASAGFRADVEAWTGEPLRTLGPSVKLEQ